MLQAHESPYASGVLDPTFYQQLLDMDEGDPDRCFSRSVLAHFFKRAEEIFDSIDTAFYHKNIVELGRLAHTLKGASAQVGLAKVPRTCEEIMHCVLVHLDPSKATTRSGFLAAINAAAADVRVDGIQPKEEWTLGIVDQLVAQLVVECKDAEQLLTNLYGGNLSE
ncbi:signal transduction histidine kinase [Cladochytrium replicatum]|nr:signal transduction histidine kinase [Cladochytrium replicatum]